MDDLISRRVAVDDLHGKDPSQVCDTADIEVWINALPSAQPEIVRCKDCRYRKFVDFGMGDCLHPSGCRGIAFDNHFCALGERREDQDE